MSLLGRGVCTPYDPSRPTAPGGPHLPRHRWRVRGGRGRCPQIGRGGGKRVARALAYSLTKVTPASTSPQYPPPFLPRAKVVQVKKAPKRQRAAVAAAVVQVVHTSLPVLFPLPPPSSLHLVEPSSDRNAKDNLIYVSINPRLRLLAHAACAARRCRDRHAVRFS